MKTTLFISSIVFLAIFLGSCDKVAPSFCDKEVDLGEFLTTIEMPYDSFEYVPLIGENGDTAGLSVNHPSALNDGSMFHHRNPITSYASDCQALRSIEKYSWNVRDKRVLALISTTNTAQFILIKAVPVFDETKPEDGPVAQYYQFFKQGAGNVIEATDFMSIMVEEEAEGQGRKWEHGTNFIGNIAIAGQPFSNVYTNSNDLNNSIEQIYFTYDKGIVGIKDGQDEMWRVQY